VGIWGNGQAGRPPGLRWSVLCGVGRRFGGLLRLRLWLLLAFGHSEAAVQRLQQPSPPFSSLLLHCLASHRLNGGGGFFRFLMPSKMLPSKPSSSSSARGRFRFTVPAGGDAAGRLAFAFSIVSPIENSSQGRRRREQREAIAGPTLRSNSFIDDESNGGRSTNNLLSQKAPSGSK
jgi:hypothetical protein